MGSRSPLEYLREEFSRYAPHLKDEPELRWLIQEGLRSAEGARWVEVAEAVQGCTLGWAPFFLEKSAQDPRALCWIVAAAYHEGRFSGVNHAGWLRSTFEKIPDIGGRLGELERNRDPWLRRTAGWARRVLSGQDRWIGGLA